MNKSLFSIFLFFIFGIIQSFSQSDGNFNNIKAKGQILVGGTTVSSSASLDIQSTTRGILVPRMSTAQRDAITTPATGLLMYNTTSLEFNQYNGTAWTTVGSADTHFASTDLTFTANRTHDLSGFNLDFSTATTTISQINHVNSNASGASRYKITNNAGYSLQFVNFGTGHTATGDIPNTTISTAGLSYINSRAATDNSKALVIGGEPLTLITSNGAAAQLDNVGFRIAGVGNVNSAATARLQVIGVDDLAGSFAARIGGLTTTGLIVTNAGFTGIGTTVPSTKLHVSSDDGSAAVTVSRYSTDAAGSGFIGTKARGTLSSPSAILSGDVLTKIIGLGYHSGGAFSLSDEPTRIRLVTSENWTATNQGAHLEFWTTPNTTITSAEVMRITHSGDVGIDIQAPTARLHVVGADDLSGTFAAKIGGATTTGLVVQNDGKVGVGTSTLPYKFNVNSAATSDYIGVTKNDIGQAFLGYRGDGGTVELNDITGTTNLVMFNALTNDFINTGKNLGIGTITPAGKLGIKSANDLISGVAFAIENTSGLLHRIFNNGTYVSTSTNVDAGGGTGFTFNHSSTNTASGSSVGILGTSNTPNASGGYQINTGGQFRAFGIAHENRGVYAIANSDKHNIAVYVEATGGTVANYGLFVAAGAITGTSPYGLYINDATVPSYHKGNLGVNTLTSTAKLHVTGVDDLAGTYAFKVNGASNDLFQISNNGYIYAGRGTALTIGKGSFYDPAKVSNTFVGTNIGGATGGGGWNTSFGNGNFTNISTGDENVSVGRAIMGGVLTGSKNIGIGTALMASITSGGSNIGIGRSTLDRVTTSSYSIGIGESAVSFNSGANNIGIGQGALRGVDGSSTGGTNIAIGFNSGIGVTTGIDNAFIGSESGESITSGSKNVMLGVNAGFWEGSETAGSSNKIYLDNIRRGGGTFFGGIEQQGRDEALIYGVTSATMESQRLTVNGITRLGRFTATEASTISPLDGDVIYVTSTDGTFTSIGVWVYENGAWVKL